MFLRCHQRQKNGKLQRYWSVVESRRMATGGRDAWGRVRQRVVPRPVLYLGEINDSPETAGRKTLTVFDEHRQPRDVCMHPRPGRPTRRAGA
ncbi:MAG: hypothetical protein KKB50_11170 [Planctomycetes bacterium]|nr:hypothetical protein [Planctomycetota bacterium]